MAASFKRTPEFRTALREALVSRKLLVVGLCAAWCNTCSEFFDAFEATAKEMPTSTFLWLDVEDDAEVVGDVDVENFPTLAIFEGAAVLHFGVSLPQAGNLSRLVRSIAGQPARIAVDPDVADLGEAIRRWSLE